MAITMDYTDVYGVQHPESYWRVALTNLCQADKVGRVVLYGYHDQEARLAGKVNCGSREYDIDPEQYEAYFCSTALSPDGNNPVKATYAFALATDNFFEDAESV